MNLDAVFFFWGRFGYQTDGLLAVLHGFTHGFSFFYPLDRFVFFFFSELEMTEEQPFTDVVLVKITDLRITAGGTFSKYVFFLGRTWGVDGVTPCFSQKGKKVPSGNLT